MAAFERALEHAVARLGVAALPSPAAQKMLQHWTLVRRWNERINLTAIESDADAAQRHYADSLAVLPHLPEGPLLDVGSGAGYPGVPIAIAQPERPVTLLEPRRRRASFLHSCVTQLDLANVTVVCARAESDPEPRYAAVVTRATFSSYAELQALTAWLRPQGQVFAYRGAPLPPSTGAGEEEINKVNSVCYEISGEPRWLLRITKR